MTYNDIMTSDNFETDYYKGWLIVYDKNFRKNYPIQLKDTKTNRNITRKQFKDAVNKYGFDKACNTFKKLYAIIDEDFSSTISIKRYGKIGG